VPEPRSQLFAIGYRSIDMDLVMGFHETAKSTRRKVDAPDRSYSTIGMRSRCDVIESICPDLEVRGHHHERRRAADVWCVKKKRNNKSIAP